MRYWIRQHAQLWSRQSAAFIQLLCLHYSSHRFVSHLCGSILQKADWASLECRTAETWSHRESWCCTRPMSASICGRKMTSDCGGAAALPGIACSCAKFLTAIVSLWSRMNPTFEPNWFEPRSEQSLRRYVSVLHI